MLTPECNTIESLANYLNIPKEQTAKALMYTRISDSKFIFVVVRGDMQASEAKLKEQVGDIRAAKLVIEEGVTFVGKTEVNPNKVTPSVPPARGTEPVRASEPVRTTELSKPGGR